ncbi:CNBP [Mytilus edulis]|uniref:CNBP n=1 Tax=Mytilus edulis TaxID=6550 RepID=A0A8S3VKM6_MYTED|nr:CNBP [Mytilus edulis]
MSADYDKCIVSFGVVLSIGDNDIDSTYFDETGYVTLFKRILDKFNEAVQGITPFEGNTKDFKAWIKSIEKYALLFNDRDRIKEIAFQTCKGACSDYIQRYLRDHRDTTWEQLKKELTSRFGEITDPQHASTLLRQLKQKGDESVQIYEENLLNLANEAYSELDGHNEAIERELVGIFIDGLAHYSYLKMKLMRENPATFSLAVKSAMTEQNLRKRFTLRTERVDEPRYKTIRPMTLTRPRRTEPLNSHEPMEIDHYRDAKRCYSCGKIGHVSRDCRSGGNLRQINAVEMQTYHGNSGRNREINCYSCGRVGHIARDCRSRGTYRQVNAVETQQYQGNSGRNNEIVCYQCNQRGHIRPNCPNRKPRTVNMVENWGVYPEN